MLAALIRVYESQTPALLAAERSEQMTQSGVAKFMLACHVSHATSEELLLAKHSVESKNFSNKIISVAISAVVSKYPSSHRNR